MSRTRKDGLTHFMLKQILLSPVCIKCGSLFRTDSLFCRICFESQIIDRIEEKKQSHLENHFYLLAWPKNKSLILNEMVYRMKSNNSEAAWKLYVNYIFVNLPVDWKSHHAIVPIPGSKQTSVHAQIFARELSRKTKLPVLEIFEKIAATEQKMLSANQRRAAGRFRLKRAPPEDFTQLIIVDDVLTTGQSYLQAARLLPARCNSLALTLFYRPLN